MKKFLVVLVVISALVSCDNGTTSSVDQGPVYVDLGPEYLMCGWEHWMGGNRIVVFDHDRIMWLDRDDGVTWYWLPATFDNNQITVTGWVSSAPDATLTQSYRFIDRNTIRLLNDTQLINWPEDRMDAFYWSYGIYQNQVSDSTQSSPFEGRWRLLQEPYGSEIYEGNTFRTSGNTTNLTGTFSYTNKTMTYYASAESVNNILFPTHTWSYEFISDTDLRKSNLDGRWTGVFRKQN